MSNITPPTFKVKTDHGDYQISFLSGNYAVISGVVFNPVTLINIRVELLHRADTWSIKQRTIRTSGGHAAPPSDKAILELCTKLLDKLYTEAVKLDGQIYEARLTEQSLKQSIEKNKLTLTSDEMRLNRITDKLEDLLNRRRQIGD